MSRPSRKAIGTGTPASTASLPITTEDSTMIAPTERSMPAVRMIRVCAMPTMPMIVTCCRIKDRLNGWKNRAPTTALNSSDAQQQHDERDRGRIGVQEVLQPLRAGLSSLEPAPRVAADEASAQPPPRRVGHAASLARSWPRRCGRGRWRPRRRPLPRIRPDQPQHFFRPSSEVIDVDALDRLVGDQRRRRC